MSYNNKLKPKINMTTTEPSCKHIIIPISNENIKKFMTSPSKHIANLNQALKGIKTNIFIDFIYNNHQSIIVIANKVASLSCYELKSLGLDKRTTLVYE